MEDYKMEEEYHTVKFYSCNDLSIEYYTERIGHIVSGKILENPSCLNEYLELYNVTQFLDNLPGLSKILGKEDAELKSIKNNLFSKVARFFSETKPEEAKSKFSNLHYKYRHDLLVCLGKFKLIDSYNFDLIKEILLGCKVPKKLWFTSKKLVSTHDESMKKILLSEDAFAELILEKELAKTKTEEYYLPLSMRPEDYAKILNSYVNSDIVNFNYLKLIESSRLNPSIGIGARLVQKVKRKIETETQKMIESGLTEIGIGYEISIVPEQKELIEIDGLDTQWKIKLSEDYLISTLDFASILNNIQQIFFHDEPMSIFVANEKHMGVMEQICSLPGKDEYKRGVFDTTWYSVGTAEVRLYCRFLESKSFRLEDVIAWFFTDYLKEEFQADGFRFRPSSESATFLERCRNLFVEMESVTHQFEHFVNNGVVDFELLSLETNSLDYNKIPSFIDNKYAYVIESSVLDGILSALFRDPTLGYVDDERRSENFVELINKFDLKISDFIPYKAERIKYLIHFGFLEENNQLLEISKTQSIALLHRLFYRDCVSFSRLSEKEKGMIKEFESKGWVRFEGSLLTSGEAELFNYMLNNCQFSNSVAYRNKYLHGTHIEDDEATHERVYFEVILLLLTLVVKINDDFCLKYVEDTGDYKSYMVFI